MSPSELHAFEVGLLLGVALGVTVHVLCFVAARWSVRHRRNGW